MCAKKVIQQNYKRHLQNKHPNEKGVGTFVQSQKMIVLPFLILANQKNKRKFYGLYPQNHNVLG